MPCLRSDVVSRCHQIGSSLRSSTTRDSRSQSASGTRQLGVERHVPTGTRKAEEQLQHVSLTHSVARAAAVEQVVAGLLLIVKQEAGWRHPSHRPLAALEHASVDALASTQVGLVRVLTRLVS
jgi:hypothetical protein